jgi:hypothetical protein
MKEDCSSSGRVYAHYKIRLWDICHDGVPGFVEDGRHEETGQSVRSLQLTGVY